MMHMRGSKRVLMDAVSRGGAVARRAVSSDPAVAAWVREQLARQEASHYVPEVDSTAAARLKDEGEVLATFLQQHKRVVAVTGAGCSTASGTPDYRSPRGSYSRGHKPVTFQEFARSHANRQRYWARGLFGWPLMAAVEPNQCHFSIAAMERMQLLKQVITQNVDTLHSRAGSKDVIELHGNMNAVVCLGCRDVSERKAFQLEMEERNQSYVRTVVEGKRQMIGAKADGDADFGLEDYSSIQIPHCKSCGEEKGVLKPAVVFFGESLEPSVKRRAMSAVEEDTDALLVVGSSLQVPSAYRIIKAAQTKGIPVLVVNVGPTKADGGDGVTKLHQEAGALLEAALAHIQRQ